MIQNLPIPSAYRLLIAAVFFLLLAAMPEAHAQRKRKDKVERTTATSMKAEVKYKQKADRTVYFIKPDTKGTLYGNPCMEEVARKMGFYYLIVPKRDLETQSQTGVFFHNLESSIIMLFRNGPFWKWKLKRRLKKCKEQTGDFVG